MDGQFIPQKLQSTMDAIELTRIAERRLRPALSDPNFLVLRSRRIIFERWFSQINDATMVLDIGGRHQPYRPLLGNRVGRYVAIDLLQTPLVNVIADGQRLPFASETFDLVIATQVFDYLPDPRQGATEVLRVLKPGGVFCLSVAAFAPRFGEEEHWRFTPTGLRSILSGFEKIEIVPELSSVGGLLRASNLAFRSFAAKNRAALKVYEVTVCPAMNLLGLGLERLKLAPNDQFAPNFSVRAVRS
jgi:SAM-dependent methyltransferase